MRLEQLRYLIEIANCKSINKAAQNLYITQPALSIAINSLEEELQYPLLKRTKKGVVLTEEGVQVLQDAQRIMSIIQNWYLEKPKQEYVLEGTVHLQAIPSVCVALSDTLILTLKNKYPKLSIFLHEKTPQYMISSLEDSPINIAITSCFQHAEKSFLRKAEESKIHAEKLAEDERCVVLSSKNPLSQKAALKKEELKNLTLAYYSDVTDDVSGSLRKYFNPDRCFRLSSRESILQLVAGDGAVGIFPREMTKNSLYAQNGLIKFVPVEDIDTKSAYYLLYPDPKAMSVNEIRLLEVIRESFDSIINKTND